MDVSAPTRSFVFGPVHSRRLGRSLGVDIVPSKLCTLDCVFCEAGRTDKRGFVRKEYSPTRMVLEEIRTELERHQDTDCLTFSGSGEPTLHASLGLMIEEFKKRSGLPVVVLTNGSLLWRDDVREDLLPADIVCPSLNAVSEDIFRRLNRPHPRLSATLVLSGLIEFRRAYRGQYWLEIMFVRGMNDSDEEVELLRDAVQQIAPDKVQINTVVRPPAEHFAKPVPLQRLVEIASLLGPKAEIIAAVGSKKHSEDRICNTRDVMNLLLRRSMSAAEIADCLSVGLPEVQNEVQRLLEAGKVHSLFHEGREYFSVTLDERLN